MALFSERAKIIKPQGEKADDFESSISQVGIDTVWLEISYDMCLIKLVDKCLLKKKKFCSQLFEWNRCPHNNKHI
jgi:hypothetical protein